MEPSENKKSPNLSFSGAGFLGLYHIGVASCMLEHAPHLVENAEKIFGCSAGAILSACLIGGVSMGDACEYTLDIVRGATKRMLGPLHPGFRLVTLVRNILTESLPPDTYVKASGKVYISLTSITDGRNVLVTDFSSNEELIDAVVCSSFIPVFSGYIPPKFRNEYFVDGGLSDNLPKDGNTITVQPWEGGADICPRDGFFPAMNYTFANTTVQMSPMNMIRFGKMLYPTSVDDLSDLCRRGFHDCYNFLKTNGYGMRKRTISRRMSFSIEWQEAIERKKKYEARKLAGLSEEDEAENSNKKGTQESEGEESTGVFNEDESVFDEELHKELIEGVERGLEIETDDEDSDGENLPRLPENIEKKIEGGDSKGGGDCAETGATKKEGRLMELIRWPLNFAAETSTNIRTHSEQATNFVFDIAVRQMHARGLIKSPSSAALMADHDPAPSDFAVNFRP